MKNRDGLTPSEYKKMKGLKSQNLRDHMTDLELIFSMLGEASTTKVTGAKNAKGFIKPPPTDIQKMAALVLNCN